jgi:Na+-transporting methylmalonyl-CoA/oxaloacetate decarboxylase gamma subunit
LPNFKSTTDSVVASKEPVTSSNSKDVVFKGMAPVLLVLLVLVIAVRWRYRPISMIFTVASTTMVLTAKSDASSVL